MKRRRLKPYTKPEAPVDRIAALAAADTLLAGAKHRFSLAALACTRGALDAEQLVRAALAAVDLARGEIARLADG